MALTAALVGKSVKVSRLKADEFRFEMLRTLTEIAEGMQDDFEKTTKTFEHPVEFVIHLSLSKGLMLAETSTTDEIYAMLNDGTPEHLITARNAPNLVYKKGYTSKTVTRWIGSRQSAYAGPTRRRKAALHPGTKPREFDSVIQEKWQPIAQSRLEKAMRRAADKSGHGIS